MILKKVDGVKFAGCEIFLCSDSDEITPEILGKNCEWFADLFDMCMLKAAKFDEHKKLTNGE